MQGPDRVVADLADPNNIQGYMQTILRIVTGAGQTVYGSDTKFTVNEGADRYCQKFESANEYTQGGTGSWSQGAAIGESDLASAITAAQLVEVTLILMVVLQLQLPEALLEH